MAGAGHAVSLDINVLLEGTPPQAHPVTVRGRRNKGTLCAPESDIKHNGLCMHAHSQQKVIHQIVKNVDFFYSVAPGLNSSLQRGRFFHTCLLVLM